MKLKIDLNNTEKRLDKCIELTTQHIALLDEIRARPDKKATFEEKKTLLAFNRPLLDANILALMLEAKARKRKAKGQGSYNPVLIGMDDNISVLEFEYKISELIYNREPFHYDCILMSSDHCSPMQIHSDGEQVRLFYIDAATYPRHLPFFNSFRTKYSNVSVYGYNGGIQSDDISCPIFSIQHLNNLSQRLLNRPEPYGLEIFSLSPIFLKHIQSTSSLPEYYRLHGAETMDKKHEKTLQMHVDEYSISVDVANTLDASLTTTKTLNVSMAYKTYKYLLAARHQLMELKESGVPVEDVLDARANCYDKNTLSSTSDHGIRARMLKSIAEKKDTEGLEKILELYFKFHDPQCLIELVNYGANLSTPRFRHTVCRVAIDECHIELLTKLLASSYYQEIEGKSKASQVLMESFVYSQKLSETRLVVLRLLLDYGADIDTISTRSYQWDGGTQSILFTAAREKDPIFVQTLIDWGAEVNFYDSDHTTALFYAASALTATALIEAGAFVNTASVYGVTPLHCAPNKDVAYVLLDNHAYINVKDAKGKTALEVALDKYIVCYKLINNPRAYPFEIERAKKEMPVFKELMLFLLEKGANASLFTMSGTMHFQSFCVNEQNVTIAGRASLPPEASLLPGQGDIESTFEVETLGSSSIRLNMLINIIETLTEQALDPENTAARPKM